MSVRFCPRCGERSFEVLKTHSFCINCNYYPEEVETTSIDTVQKLFTQESKDELDRWARQLEAAM